MQNWQNLYINIPEKIVLKEHTSQSGVENNYLYRPADFRHYL